MFTPLTDICRHLTFIGFIIYKVIQWRLKLEPQKEETLRTIEEFKQNPYLEWGRYREQLTSMNLTDLQLVEKR